MQIQKFIVNMFVFLLLMVTFQVQAGVNFSFDEVSAQAGGTAQVPLKITADGDHSISAGKIVVEYDSSVLTPNLTAIQSKTNGWSVTAVEQPPAPDASISESAFELLFYPDATGTTLDLTANSNITLAELPVAVTGQRAVKRAELFFSHEGSMISFENSTDHVFINFNDSAVKVTSWEAVWANASDTAISAADLSGKLFFQVKKDDQTGEKYAVHWLFRDGSTGWRKEYQGLSSSTQQPVVLTREFNWTVSGDGRLNLDGIGTDWSRVFALLPGATVNQLPLYGGSTAIDGTSTPLLFEINRDFTMDVTTAMPRMLQIYGMDDRGPYNEVILFEQGGMGRFGSSTGEQGSFNWEIGTAGVERGAIKVTEARYDGTISTETFHVLKDGFEDELWLVSISDEGFDMEWVDVLTTEPFDVDKDLKYQAWKVDGENIELMFHDATDSQQIGQLTTYMGDEQQGYTAMPFRWAVDASGTLHYESDAFDESFRVVKVAGGGDNGYLEVVNLDDPSGVEHLFKGFSEHNVGNEDGAMLWLSRDSASDNAQTKRLNLEVGGLAGRDIKALDITLMYDCNAGQLGKVDGEAAGSCSDGKHLVSKNFSPSKGDGQVLELDFSVNGNLLWVGIDQQKTTATDSSNTPISFTRMEGTEIVGKQLMLVAEIEAEKNNMMEMVTIAAPQHWFDPSTNQLNLPSNLADLEGLLHTVFDKGYEDTSLGGTGDNEGEGFRIRFAVYEDANGDFRVGSGDSYAYSLPTELVRVNDAYMDSYKNEFFAEGWYVADHYGMTAMTDGQAVGPVDAVDTVDGKAVEYGQQVMLDLIVFDPTGDGEPLNRPRVLPGATFDLHSNSVILPSVTELESFWTGINNQNGTVTVSDDASGTNVMASVLPPEDASSTARGFVFIAQVFDGTKDASGTLQIAQDAKPLFTGEMELVKFTAQGTIGGMTFGPGDFADPYCDTCKFYNDGWFVHSYNDDIDQDILWPVNGGDWINSHKLDYDEHGNVSGDMPGGFGGEEVAQLDASDTRFVLAQMDFENQQLGAQFQMTGLDLLQTATGEQQVSITAASESALPDSSDTTFTSLNAMQFDPKDPKGGKGILFKVLAFEDTDSNGQYDDGEKVLEMGGMVAYVTDKARSPMGDKILPQGWYVITFSHEGDQVLPFSEAVNQSMHLMPYVQMGEMQGGVNKAQEGGCETVDSSEYSRCQVIGTIEGQIVDAQGNGVPNLWINFEPDNWEYAEWGGTNTKSDGSFSIKLSGNQKYRLWIDTFGAQGGYLGGYYNGSAGITEMWDQAKLVEASRLGNQIGKIGLTKGTSVTITVIDNNGDPVEDLWVNMEPDGEGNWAGANTDSQGIATVGVMNGQYRIWVDTYNTGGSFISGFYDAATGGVTGDWGKATIVQVRGDKAVEVQLSKGITLSGTVLDGNGVPVGDAGINIRSKGEDDESSTDEFNYGWNDPFAGGFQTWTQTSCDDPSRMWCYNEASDTWGTFSATVEPGKEYMVEIHTPDGMGGSFIYKATDDSSTAVLEGVLTRDWDDQNQIQVYDPVRIENSSVEIKVSLQKGTSITGVIKDSSGKPMKHAWVDFNSDQGGWGGGSTGENGQYTVQLEPNKTYRMNVWPSWDDEQKNGIMGGQVRLKDGDDLTDYTAEGTITQNWDQATQITLGSDDLTINVSTSAGVSISGKVVTNNAKYCEATGSTVVDGFCGMRDVHVNAWSEDGFGGRGAPTDANGTYSINVQPGTGYIVDIWTPNGMNAYYGGEQGTVFSWNEAKRLDISGSVTGIDLKLQKSYAITGRVLRDDRTPVRWIWVNAISKSKDRYMGASTDHNGFYRMEVPSADDYIIEVWGGDRGFTTSYYSRSGTVTDERHASRLDLTSQNQSAINVVMSTGKSISGVIKGLSAGERLWLNAWSESKMNGGGAEVVGTSSGGDVAFTIKGLAASNDYQLDWWHHKYASGFYGVDNDGDGYAEPVEWHNRDRLDTTAADITGLKIEMSTGGTLEGSVDGLQQGDKVYVNLWSESGKGFGWQEITGDADTDSADSFTIEGLKSSSDYILDLHSDWNNTGDYKGGFYRTTDNHSTGSLSHWEDKSQILVTSGQTTILPKLSLASTAGKISGSITGLEAGDRAWVDAWSEKSGSWGGTEISGTDSTDSYQLKGLDAANDYRVSIWVEGKAGGFYAGVGESLTNFWEDASKVTVAGNSTTENVDLTIETGVAIAGTVSGLQSGEFAWIDAFDEGLMFGNGTSIVGQGADTDITFTLEGMRANTGSSKASGYRIMMDAYGYPVQFWNDSTDSTPMTWENATLLKTAVDSTDQVSFTITDGNSISGTIDGFSRNDWIFIDAWSQSTGSMGFANVDPANVKGCNSEGDNCSATYTIEGLSPASDYVVGADRNGMRIFHSAAGSSVTSPDDATRVNASSADQTDVDLSFAITTYTLTVTIEGLAADSEATVYLNAWDPQGGFGWDKRKGNGTITVENLPAGDYYISAWPEGSSELFYDASGAVKRYDEAGQLTINGDESLTFSWATDETYAISGTVTSDGSTVIANQLVSAFSAKANAYQSTITDSNGAFSFDALPPESDYVVDAWTAFGHLEHSPVDISSADVSGVALKPAATGIHNLEVDYGSGPVILGLFKDNRFVKAGVSDVSGIFTFKGLENNGNYLVKVDADLDGDYADDNIQKAHTGATSNTALQFSN